MNITKHEHPWYYETIENVFSDENYSVIRNFAEKNKKNIQQKYVLSSSDWDDTQVNLIVASLINSIKDYFFKNKSNFPEARLVEGEYLTLVDLQYSPKEPYEYPIHSESVMKTFSFVIYISPDENNGTNLFLKQGGKVPDVTIPWKTNTAMMFCGVENKTWHSFSSLGQNERITLNIFLVPKEFKEAYPHKNMFKQGHFWQ